MTGVSVRDDCDILGTMRKTKHSGLFEILKREIVEGKYDATGMLPSEAALARRFGLSRPTVQRTLRDFEREGLIVKRKGCGSFVVPPSRRGRTVVLTPMGGRPSRPKLTAAFRALLETVDDETLSTLEISVRLRSKTVLTQNQIEVIAK